MILANWPRRASEEPHSSTAPNRLVEAYFLLWSVSLSSDAPYWRPPSRDAQYGLSVGVMVSKPVCGPRQRSAESIPDYSQMTDNTQRRCAVHTKSGKEIKLNGLVGSVPSSIPQTS